MPQNAEPGTWVVTSLQVADRANNYRFYDTGALSQMGFPTELQVASGRDVEPPVLTAFDLTPRSVDVTGGPAAVTCEMSASDTLSGVGVRAAGCQFRSPDGAPGPLCVADHPSSGDAYDGVRVCAVTIAQFVQPGTWVVSEVQIVDGSNNIQVYGGAELNQLGFPSTVQVISNHDVRPPDLADFDFNPKSVDVLNGPASVTCGVRLSDELAGVQFVTCNFQSPSGHEGSSCDANLPSSGIVNDGEWTCPVTLPQGSEPGRWVVSGLQVVDRVGNGAFYGTYDLDQLGFETELAVTADQTVQDSDGDGVIDSADACPSSVLGATVSIEGVDSGVPNPLSPSACTLSDQVSHCALAARNHGTFVKCVRHSCDLFVEAGLATLRNPPGKVFDRQRCFGGYFVVRNPASWDRWFEPLLRRLPALIAVLRGDPQVGAPRDTLRNQEKIPAHPYPKVGRGGSHPERPIGPDVVPLPARRKDRRRGHGRCLEGPRHPTRSADRPQAPAAGV